MKPIKFRTVIALLFLYGITISTVSAKPSYKSEILKAANVKKSGAYVREKFVSLLGKTFDDSSQKKVLIIGDSHAQDFINMAYESGHFANYQVKTRHIPTGCQVILVDNAEQYIEEKLTDLCEKSDSLEKALDQIKQADILILVANWTEWSAKELPNTIKNLNLNDNQTLYIIGRKSFGKLNIRKLVRKSKNDLLKIENKTDAKQETINKIMRSNLSKDIYVDFQNIICGTEDKCKIFTDDIHLITFDGGHLTKNGAIFLGKRLFDESILKNLE